MFSRSVAVIAFVAVLAPATARAAEPEVAWSRGVGRRDTAVAVRAGAVYAAGSMSVQTVSQLRYAAVVVKFDRSGSVRWRRSWRPAGSSAVAVDIAVTSRGDVYVVGTISEAFGCGGWWLRAYRADGTLRWHIDREGGGCGLAQAVAANDRTVVVATGDLRDGYGVVDGWVVAFGRDGELRWRRSLRVAGYGDDQYDAVADVAIGRRDQAVAVGVAAQRPNDPSEVPDVDGVVVRFSPAGARRWIRVDDDPWRSSVAIGGGSVILAGVPSGAAQIGRVERISSAGAILWSRALPDALSFRVGVPVDVAAGRDGGAVASWSARRGEERRVVLRAFTANGARRWTEVLRAPGGGWWSTSVAVRGSTVAAGGLHGVLYGPLSRGRVWRVAA